ncbi:YqhA family protein [Candidatus Vesicomyidisocius sp. SY067_SCS001]|uniref:YqhA family protein n=1 Tax=Candidatus Vesicomyidisocius sp. SY067_SCS001 TaxID=2732590 RepID=UPI0016898C24|nr:YqhA family protein [Candidatus Vesicomyosocius sp. SY067_SCS001]
MNGLEKYFEKLLWGSRYMVLVAVISSLLLSLLLFVITAVDVFALLVHIFDYIIATPEIRKVLKIELVAHTVGSIDGFLLATILLIFSLGLYELFISDIDEAKDSDQSSKVLVINSLDDLKSKLAKVILMILVVTFFEVSLLMSFDSSLDLVYFSLGILMVSLALYFGSKSSH